MLDIVVKKADLRSWKWSWCRGYWELDATQNYEAGSTK